MDIIIINGPNLNLIGTREPEIYGSLTMEEVYSRLVEKYTDIKLQYFQSNHEGGLIDKLQEVGFSYDGVILNAGAYTHTSIAIADAIKAITTPVIELHISNVYERETFRHHSYIADNCIHHIIGKGVDGYEDALRYFLDKS